MIAQQGPLVGPMRIAAVTGFPPDSYGEAHYSGEVYGSLAAQRPEVQILVLAHRREDSPEESQLSQNLSVKRVTRPEDGRARATLAIGRLFWELLKFKPTVVHFQGTHTSKYGGLFGEPITLLVLVLRALQIPSIVTLHSLWSPSALSHLWAEKRLPAFLSSLLTWYFGANMRVLARHAALLRFASATASSPLPGEYLNAYGMRPRRVELEVHPCKYTPVDAGRRESAKAALGVGGELIVAAGFVREDKGFHLLLECADDVLDVLPAASIVIAGEAVRPEDRDYAARLTRLRAGLRHKTRVFVDIRRLSDQEFARGFDAADVVVVPYLMGLGASGPLHHGLGRGVPVVASDLPLMQSFAGICKLFETNKSEALGRALLSVLCSPTEYSRYCAAAHAYASQNTWDGLARKYFEHFIAIGQRSES